MNRNTHHDLGAASRNSAEKIIEELSREVREDDPVDSESLSTGAQTLSRLMTVVIGEGGVDDELVSVLGDLLNAFVVRVSQRHDAGDREASLELAKSMELVSKQRHRCQAHLNPGRRR